MDPKKSIPAQSDNKSKILITILFIAIFIGTIVFSLSMYIPGLTEFADQAKERRNADRKLP